MFFFLGGISPKTVTAISNQSCPRCGGGMAAERVDHILSLFLIPVLTVSTGKPYHFFCPRCGFEEAAPEARIEEQQRSSGNYLPPPYQHPQAGRQQPHQQPGGGFRRPVQPAEEEEARPSAPPLRHAEHQDVCGTCGRGVQPSFLFCPFCGAWLGKD